MIAEWVRDLARAYADWLPPEGIAPRPLQSTLDLSKLHDTGIKSRDWEDDLKDYIQKEMSR